MPQLLLSVVAEVLPPRAPLRLRKVVLEEMSLGKKDVIESHYIKDLDGDAYYEESKEELPKGKSVPYSVYPSDDEESYIAHTKQDEDHPAYEPLKGKRKVLDPGAQLLLNILGKVC